MTRLRALLNEHRMVFLWLVLASLAMRAFVPVGYMVSARSLVLTVEVCADTSGEHLTRQISLPGSGEPATPKTGDHPPACPFSGLSALGLAAEAPAIFAAALAFVLALGFAALALPAPKPCARLRPPLRGPPILA